MKALTVRQPWASLIAGGTKTIETRSWPTSYRGPLAIHAGKAVAHPSDRIWERSGRGVRLSLAVIAVAELTDVLVIAHVGTTLSASLLDRRHGFLVDQGVHGLRIAQPATGDHGWVLTDVSAQRDLGHYPHESYAWLLGNVRRLRRPVRCNGALGLWDLPSDIEQEVARATPT